MYGTYSNMLGNFRWRMNTLTIYEPKILSNPE